MKKKYSAVSYLLIAPMLVLVLSAVMVSCKKDTTTDTSVGSNVKLIINNLSPDVYPVRLYINNIVQNPTNTTTTLASAQTYATYRYNTPSAYFAVKASGYPLQIRSTRTVDSVLFNVNDTLKSNTSYTLFVTGFLSDNSIKFILTTDYTVGDTASLPKRGRGKLRFVNGTLKTTNGYDVYANGTIAFSNINYPNVSSFIELPAGTYDFKFVNTGASINTSSNILIDLPGVTVQDGHIYTLYSRGVNGRLSTDTAAVGAGIITNH